MLHANIGKARDHLARSAAPGSPYATLAAAALAATAAVLLAGVMVLGPGVRFEDSPAVISRP